MALSLILKLKSNLNVLVTNSETKEQREVTLDFIQKITNSSLPMLCQYKYYELISNAPRCWSRIKHFDLQIESEMTRQIDLKYEKIKKTRESHTIQKDREQYNSSTLILKLQNSYNNISTALQYADYCLKHDYRYNSKEENIKPNVTIQVAQKDGLKEEQNNYNVLQGNRIKIIS